MDTLAIRTSDLREILALIPHQLGFAPAESLVAVSVHPSGRIGVIARVDLSEVTGPEGPAVAASLVEILRADGAQVAMLAFYTDADADEADTVAITTGERMAGAAGAHMGIATPLIVTGGAYRFVGAPTLVPLALDRAVMTAEMVLRGSVVAKSREDLAVVAPAPAGARRVAAAAARRVQVRRADGEDCRAEALSLFRSACADPDARTPRVLGFLNAACTDVLARDVLLLETWDRGDAAEALAHGDREAGSRGVSEALRTPVWPDAAHVAAAVEVLVAMVAHATNVQVQVPARTMLAAAAWFMGDLTRANVWLESLPAEHEYRLADLLWQTVGRGMPPEWVRASSLESRR